MTAPREADRCEVCGRPLISRRVRRTGRCGAHPRQPALPLDPPPSERERNDQR
jgi:hypothetical protein